MTVDRKRLRELALATINVLQRRRGFNGWWDGIDDETQDEILNAIVDALEAAEQPALPMDDALNAAINRAARDLPEGLVVAVHAERGSGWAIPNASNRARIPD